MSQSRRTSVSEALLTVAGANREVLRQAPSERTKQAAMGAVLVAVAGIAAASATYALNVALHLPIVFALVGGLLWGLIILNLDRWLVVSTPRLSRWFWTLAMAVPRVLLAVLIGAVVSTPLTLAVFRAEIDAELQVMAAEREDAFSQQLAADSRFSTVPAQEQRILELQGAIADGVTDADVLADPAVIALQRRVDEARARFDAAAAAYQCENDGTCGTGDRGVGDVSREKAAERDRLQGEWQDLAAELAVLTPQVREQLEVTDALQATTQQAEVAALQAEVADAQAERDQEMAAHEAEVGVSDGILARLAALGRVEDQDPALGRAHLLLFLFMTALECVPILFKTMLALAPPSLYERLVKLEEERAEARTRLRIQAEYEEAETMARSALAAAEARAARTLEAESKATGIVLDAQLAVTRDSVRRWRDEQRVRPAGDDAAVTVDQLDDEYLTQLERDLASAGESHEHLAGASPTPTA